MDERLDFTCCLENVVDGYEIIRGHCSAKQVVQCRMVLGRYLVTGQERVILVTPYEGDACVLLSCISYEVYVGFLDCGGCILLQQILLVGWRLVITKLRIV